MTRWTRLSRDPIWEVARVAHRRRYGRVYHDFDRVLRLYDRADRVLDLPYDRALDLAILSHSSIVDFDGDRRPRSAAWLRAHAGPEEPLSTASRMILNGPYQDLSDPRLPLLELSDLADPEAAAQAISDMTDQVRLLTRMSPDEIRSEIRAELARIRRALNAALPRIREPALRDLAQRIISGSVQKHLDNL